jgi:hypothetical protein
MSNVSSGNMQKGSGRNSAPKAINEAALLLKELL